MEKGSFATAAQMKKLDDIAVGSGLEIRQMMEHAAYHAAQFVIDRFEDKKVGCFAGTGNNGGDSIAAARFLHNAGFEVEIVLLKSEQDLKPDGRHHLELCKRIGVPVRHFRITDTYEYDVVLDGLIGYALQGDPMSPYKECIEMLNNSKAIIIAIDLPSGFDANEIRALEPCVRADATLFLAHAKQGYTENKEHFGECYLVDLGIPKILYEEVGLEYPF